ncbi:MAG TPA: hypothetical protein VIN38_00335 [Thiobacillus sp.]
MIKRQMLIFGLATLGLALTAPVQAAPHFMDGAFIVAKRDQPEESRQDKRGTRKDERREAGREAPQGYGYGYERRQQERNDKEDRSRERR